MKTMRRMLLLAALMAALLIGAAAEDGPLTLPAELKVVGYEAFMGDTSIEEVVIPEGVTLISSSAFSGCSNLRVAAIPGTVEVVDSEAFKDCASLSELTIAEGVREIRWSAFENCASLTEVTLPASLTDIGLWAFKGCDSLSVVHAEPDTYAYTWAIENGYITLDGALDVSARLYDGDTRMVGPRLLWEHLSGASSKLALYVHAERAGAVSADSDWIALEDGEALDEGDSTVTFRLSANHTGKTREGAITLTTPEATRVVVIRQLPYLMPTLRLPEALVGRESLAETASASVVLPYADHVFEWSAVEGATGYAVGVETPLRYLHGSDGDVPFAAYSQLGSDGAVPFVTYRGERPGSNGWEPFVEADLTAGDTFSARVERSMLVLGAKDPHRVFLWVYDAWGHRYSVFYDFLVRDGVDDEWDYVLNRDSDTGDIVGATITGYKGDAAEVAIPATLSGAPVLAIDSEAFSGSATIASVTVPEGVTTIGYRSFYRCRNLKSVRLPETLVKLCDSAFRDCEALVDINLPDGLASIGKYAFMGCSSLPGVTLPAALRRVQTAAFQDCSSLETATLKPGLTRIDRRAFKNCAALKAIHFPEGVTRIDYEVLSGCSALEEATLPGTLESIYWDLFDDCDNLRKVNAREGTMAYAWAVENGYITFEADRLAVVPGMNDGELIEEDGMPVWRHLDGDAWGQDIIVIAPEPWSMSWTPEAGAISEATPHQESDIVAAVDGLYPAGTFTVSVWLTRNLTGASRDIALTFTCGERTERLVLRQLPYLESKLLAPAALAENGAWDKAREDYPRLPLDDLTLEWESVAGASRYELYLYYFDYEGGEYDWKDTGISFEGGASGSLTTTLDRSSFSIDPNHAFAVKLVVYDAYGHQYFYHDADEQEYGWYHFFIIDPDLPDWGYALNEDGGETTVTLLGYGGSAAELEVPSELLGHPVTAIGDSAFSGIQNLTRVAIPDSVTRIGGWAFSGCKNLSYASIPDSVTELGIGLFHECVRLGDARLPAGLTAVPQETFSHCEGLSEIDLPASVVEIGDNAFGYSGLTRIEPPAGLEVIEDFAFYGCDRLTEVKLPGTLIRVDYYAFGNCASLAEIELPEGLPAIGNYVFAECPSLSRVVIPDSVTSLGSGVFTRCAALTEIRIPEGVTALGWGLFQNCERLADVRLPDSLTHIGSWVFQNCEALEALDLPEDLEKVGHGAFYQCKSLRRIAIPQGATAILDRAFEGCDALNEIEIPDTVTSIGISAIPSETIVVTPEGSYADAWARDRGYEVRE